MTDHGPVPPRERRRRDCAQLARTLEASTYVPREFATVVDDPARGGYIVEATLRDGLSAAPPGVLGIVRRAGFACLAEPRNGRVRVLAVPHEEATH